MNPPPMEPEPQPENNLDESSGITPRSLSFVSLVSGLIWIIAGFLGITLFHDRPISEVLLAGEPILRQVFTGAVTGLFFGWIGVKMLHHDRFRKTLNDYPMIRILETTPLSKPLIIQISLIAGISEEFLFRAVVQPLLGVWVTSIIFIALHGYIRFKSVSQLLFTIFTFALSLILGYLFIYFGLVSAITAHAIYDYRVLNGLERQKKPHPQE